MFPNSVAVFVYSYISDSMSRVNKGRRTNWKCVEIEVCLRTKMIKHRRSCTFMWYTVTTSEEYGILLRGEWVDLNERKTNVVFLRSQKIGRRPRESGRADSLTNSTAERWPRAGRRGRMSRVGHCHPRHEFNPTTIGMVRANSHGRTAPKLKCSDCTRLPIR